MPWRWVVVVTLVLPMAGCSLLGAAGGAIRDTQRVEVTSVAQAGTLRSRTRLRVTTPDGSVHRGRYGGLTGAPVAQAPDGADGTWWELPSEAALVGSQELILTQGDQAFRVPMHEGYRIEVVSRRGLRRGILIGLALDVAFWAVIGGLMASADWYEDE
jgi:hypothetical protein